MFFLNVIGGYGRYAPAPSTIHLTFTLTSGDLSSLLFGYDNGTIGTFGSTDPDPIGSGYTLNALWDARSSVPSQINMTVDHDPTTELGYDSETELFSTKVYVNGVAYPFIEEGYDPGTASWHIEDQGDGTWIAWGLWFDGASLPTPGQPDFSPSGTDFLIEIKV